MRGCGPTHAVAAKRLAGRRLTVIDATNVQKEARRPLVTLARAYHCLPVAIVLDMPEKLCVALRVRKSSVSPVRPQLF